MEKLVAINFKVFFIIFILHSTLMHLDAVFAEEVDDFGMFKVDSNI